MLSGQLVIEKNHKTKYPCHVKSWEIVLNSQVSAITMKSVGDLDPLMLLLYSLLNLFAFKVV